MEVQNIKIALLKSKSPSCSTKKVYDGSFSKTLLDGLGVSAEILTKNGILIYDENEIEKILDI